MPLNKLSLFFLFTFIYSVAVVESYKYLGILPTVSKSRFAFGSALFKGLARKGHEVHVISAFPQKDPIENYFDMPFKSNATNDTDHLSAEILREHALYLLYDSNHNFDGVICDVLFCDALFGFSEHFKAPLIGLGSGGPVLWNTDMIGSPSPPSYVPATMAMHSDRMSFIKRLKNLYFIAVEKYKITFNVLPRQKVLYQKYFPHLNKDLLSVRKNIAVVLLNSHVSLSYPRPYMPNQIEVGGLHIDPQRKPLPATIGKFIEEAEHGVVYFSLGSNFKFSTLPLVYKNMFLKAFAQLKQRVLWKYDKQLKNKPDNVYISNWFPQNDILANENVKVFITAGSHLSVIESIYHGIPMVGLPMTADQIRSIKKPQADGIGIMLDFETLNAENLIAAVKSITTDIDYVRRIKNISARFRDQPILPLDRAIYWVEHVTRQRGAKYLYCTGLDLNFIQYHNLDVIFLLLLIILLIAHIFLYLTYRIYLCLEKLFPRRNTLRI